MLKHEIKNIRYIYLIRHGQENQTHQTSNTDNSIDDRKTKSALTKTGTNQEEDHKIRQHRQLEHREEQMTS